MTGLRTDMKSKKARKVALLGVFGAEAIALSFLESLLPSFIPGAKLGLSNIVTMFFASALGARYALGVTLFKAIFALVTRGYTSFLMSLCGGFLSLAGMLILFRLSKEKVGYIGIGVASAVLHNIGQLVVAGFLIEKSVYSLTAALILVGAVTGILTGTVLKLLMPVLLRLRHIAVDKE